MRASGAWSTVLQKVSEDLTCRAALRNLWPLSLRWRLRGTPTRSCFAGVGPQLAGPERVGGWIAETPGASVTFLAAGVVCLAAVATGQTATFPPPAVLCCEDRGADPSTAGHLDDAIAALQAGRAGNLKAAPKEGREGLRLQPEDAAIHNALRGLLEAVSIGSHEGYETLGKKQGMNCL